MRTRLHPSFFALFGGLGACGATPRAALVAAPDEQTLRAALISETAGGDTGAVAGEPPPNILVIVADDMGVDKVRAFVDDEPGYLSIAQQLPATPTIDALATAGLRFTTAWSNPLCSPTRATLQTGRYAFRTNVGRPYPEGPALSGTETTLAQQLQAGSGGESWATGYFGKWHLGSAGVGGTTDWSLSGVTDRVVKDEPNPAVFGWSTFDGTLLGVLEDYHSWTRVVTEGPGRTRVLQETTYATASTTASASAWISAQTGPWFATVAYSAPHLSSANAGNYGDSDLDPACAPLPAFAGGDHERAVYRGLVECMDDRIGALLRGIPTDQLANTLIVFLGDNGTPGRVMEGLYGSRGGRATNGKSSAYESGVHVPLIVVDGTNWIEWQACSPLRRRNGECSLSDHRITTPGRVVSAPVQLVDMYATIAALTHVDASTAVDSVSFADCLTADDPSCSGDTRETPRRLYTEGFSCSDDATPCDPAHLVNGMAAIRRGPYKLVTTFDRSLGCLTDELYAVRRDPHEQNDIVTTQPDVARRLHDELADLGAPWMSGIGNCGG